MQVLTTPSIRRCLICLCATVVLTGQPAVGQTAPTVNNVVAAQRNDGSRLVDVYYDLSHNAPSTVWVVFSGDGGVSWNEKGKDILSPEGARDIRGEGLRRSVK